jgi:hypothetical protein
MSEKDEKKKFIVETQAICPPLSDKEKKHPKKVKVIVTTEAATPS